MAKGTTKAQKLKEMKLVDGKSAPDVYTNVKTIDEILGTTPSGPFKAVSLAQFEKQVDEEMNLADMQALASRVGLLPIHDRPLLKKRLVDEFKKDLRKKTPYDVSSAAGQSDNLDYNVGDKARRILKEGQ